MSEKLLPCPFCGETDELYIEDTEGAPYPIFPWMAQCGSCFCTVYDTTQCGVIAAWNRRKTPMRTTDDALAAFEGREGDK